MMVLDSGAVTRLAERSARAAALIAALRAEAHLLLSLSMLYAYTGRFGDARAALARSRSISAGFGAKLALAYTAIGAGHIELTAGDAAAAKGYLREGYEAFHAVAERGASAYLAALLAEALYRQGRLDEAQQMTEEAERSAAPGDVDPHAQWRAARAKVLARRGQFPAARTLLDEAAALVTPTSWAVLQAGILMATAEVDRLAGAPEQAKASLRAALGIYQDRHATPLADQATAALASLTGHPSAESA